MSRKILLAILLSGVFMSLKAQVSSVNGLVTNEKGEPLPSATVVLLDPSDSTMISFGISNAEGAWEIKAVRPGNYLMQFAFLGYETAYRAIESPLKDGPFWGVMAMTPKPVNLDGVQVIGEYVPMQIKKDTIEFNARAFKTKPDAVVEDLLKKLPGIQIDRSGNIKAMGEDVSKVLVDGKEFFGADPKVATRNLPAESLEKVQVFDKKSEEAEFTGIDDGSRNKALNLVLKEDQKKGVFGHLQGGYGTDNHYQANAKMYKFNDKIQAAALAMQNNINQFGFSFQDYLDFKGGIGSLMSGGSARIEISADGNSPINFGQQQSGLTSSGAGGLNFSYSWNKDRRAYISYLGSGKDTYLERLTYSENFLTDGSYIQRDSLGQNQRDTTHGINFGVRYEIDSTQSIFLDGNGSLTFANQWGESYTTSLADAILQNRQNRAANNGSERGSIGAGASYLKKMNANKTVLKIAGNGNYSASSSRLDWTNRDWFIGRDQEQTSALYQKTDTKNESYTGSLSVTQKLSGKYFITPDFSVNSRYDELNRTQGLPWPDDAIIDSLSPDFNFNHLKFQGGLNLKRSTESTQMNFSLDAQMNQTRNSLWGDGGMDYEQETFYLLPGFNLDWEYRSGHRLNLMYQSNVAQPTLNQLLPVQDNTNSLSVFYGNRLLKPEFQNNVFAHWIIFDQFSFTSFFTSLNLNYTRDKINWSRTIDDQFRQTATLINVEDDYSARANIDFSTPIRKLGVKVNLGLSESWNRGMNLVNGLENTNTNLSHNFSISLENRKKDKWDVIAGGSLRITDARYSLQQSLNNRYTDFSYYTEIRFTPNEDWNFNATADVTSYNDRSFGESLTVPLIGAEISYYFLANNRASLSLQGADLLNKNKGITRISEMNYLRETRTNIIGRYVMLSFKYRLNKLGGNGGGLVVKAHR